MRLKNETQWNTQQLRAIIARIAKEELNTIQRKQLVVFVKRGKMTHGGTVAGNASCPGHHLTIYLPPESVDRESLAHTLCHEMAHTRGMTHRQMRGSTRYSYSGDWRGVWSWVNTYLLTKKASRPTLSPTERTSTKLEHAMKLEKLWARRAKRAMKLHKKWANKVRYYTGKQLTAAAALPTQGEAK